MKTEINRAIEVLAGKITENVESSDALKFTQAALNLAHVNAVNINNDKDGKK
tara:strand:+ start:149 stop:304 length:156 start_codon:yes stop_codon:yes gene_type:complete